MSNIPHLKRTIHRILGEELAQRRLPEVVEDIVNAVNIVNNDEETNLQKKIKTLKEELKLSRESNVELSNAVLNLQTRRTELEKSCLRSSNIEKVFHSFVALINSSEPKTDNVKTQPKKTADTVEVLVVHSDKGNWLTPEQYLDRMENRGLKTTFERQREQFYSNKTWVEFLSYKIQETKNHVKLPYGFKSEHRKNSKGFYKTHYPVELLQHIELGLALPSRLK
jgi:molecular chaperone GrpE (heat shock protein)